MISENQKLILDNIEKQYKNKKLHNFMYYFSKTLFFILTVILIFLYTKLLYSNELLEKMKFNSGLQVTELTFIMGFCLGIWLFFSFLLLVFTNKDR